MEKHLKEEAFSFPDALYEDECVAVYHIETESGWCAVIDGRTAYRKAAGEFLQEGWQFEEKIYTPMPGVEGCFSLSIHTNVYTKPATADEIKDIVQQVKQAREAGKLYAADI